ncbi:MAG: hypothetical protein JST64_14135, partial [Actinobacteria bacterium]|nr:hypothetical protein [Actinomycetota bacterium]
NPSLARLTFALALLGAGAGVIGMLATSAVVVRVAGMCICLVGITATANLVSGPMLMIRWHRRHTGVVAPDQEVPT